MRTWIYKLNNFKIDISILAAGITLIMLFIISTNPSNLSITFLLAFPVLVAVTGFVAAKLFLQAFTSMNDAMIRTICVVVASGILLLLFLGSLGQLGVQDVLLAILLISGLVFYLKRVHLTS